MSTAAVIGVDIGTSSSKGVLVDLAGRILAQTTRELTMALTSSRSTSAGWPVRSRHG